MQKRQCPECGSTKVSVWKNEDRRQLVGKCHGCGKMVTFGRPQETEQIATGKEKVIAPQKTAKPEAQPKAKPAPASPRLAPAVKPGASPKARLARGDQKPVSEPESALPRALKRFLDFFND